MLGQPAVKRKRGQKLHLTFCNLSFCKDVGALCDVLILAAPGIGVKCFGENLWGLGRFAWPMLVYPPKASGGYQVLKADTTIRLLRCQPLPHVIGPIVPTLWPYTGTRNVFTVVSVTGLICRSYRLFIGLSMSTGPRGAGVVKEKALLK